MNSTYVALFGGVVGYAIYKHLTNQTVPKLRYPTDIPVKMLIKSNEDIYPSLIKPKPVKQPFTFEPKYTSNPFQDKNISMNIWINVDENTAHYFTQEEKFIEEQETELIRNRIRYIKDYVTWDYDEKLQPFQSDGNLLRAHYKASKVVPYYGNIITYHLQVNNEWCDGNDVTKLLEIIHKL